MYLDGLSYQLIGMFGTRRILLASLGVIEWNSTESIIDLSETPDMSVLRLQNLGSGHNKLYLAGTTSLDSLAPATVAETSAWTNG